MEYKYVKINMRVECQLDVYDNYRAESGLRNQTQVSVTSLDALTLNIVQFFSSWPSKCSLSYSVKVTHNSQITNQTLVDIINNICTISENILTFHSDTLEYGFPSQINCTVTAQTGTYTL